MTADRGALAQFDLAFAESPLCEATVNAAVDWLKESGATLFDVLVAFAAAPNPEQGWQRVLARWDRLTNGENVRAPYNGYRRCDVVRAAKLPTTEKVWWVDLDEATPYRRTKRERMVRDVLQQFYPVIDIREVLFTAGLEKKTPITAAPATPPASPH